MSSSKRAEEQKEESPNNIREKERKKEGEKIKKRKNNIFYGPPNLIKLFYRNLLHICGRSPSGCFIELGPIAEWRKQE